MQAVSPGVGAAFGHGIDAVVLSAYAVYPLPSVKDVCVVVNRGVHFAGGGFEEK